MTKQAEQGKRKLSVVGKGKLPKRPEPARPSFSVFDGPVKAGEFTYKPGVWYHVPAKNLDDADTQNPDIWVCAPLKVEAETINSDDGSVGRLLSFVHRGRRKEWIMPMERLAGKGDELLKDLLRHGLVVNYQHRNLVAQYVAHHREPEEILSTTTRPGWHESGAFVLPERTIGNEKVRYQSTGRVASMFTARGTLEDWKTEVASLCRGNPVLILAISCGLAGPLLRPLGLDGVIFHLVGDSSSGKSLGQHVGASTWSNPAVFAGSWDVSKGGIEIAAASRNDTLLVLDEIKRANPRAIQEMVYAIGNGQGKTTMTREREGRPQLRWRVVALSSGERSLSDHAEVSGNAAHAGAELRMIDVNAGTRPYRAFDELHGMTGETFHRKLSGAVGAQHGHAGPAFVEKLLQAKEDELTQRFARVREAFQAEGAQAGRVADKFALVALAGELATEWSVVPWSQGEALKSCQSLFQEWREHAGSGNAEDRQILAAFADFIALHGDSRFSDIKEIARDIKNRAGYYELVGGERLYLFNRPALQEAARGFSASRITRALKTAGALIKAEEWNKKKYRLPGGGSARFYVIDPAKLEDPENA